MYGSTSTVENKEKKQNETEFNNFYQEQHHKCDDNEYEHEDFETAIIATGYGKFHYFLLFVCGWANAR